MKKMGTNKLVMMAMFAALIFLGTYIHIEIPIGGGVSMIHLGTTVIFIVAVLIGEKAALPAAIGSALMDALTPAFALWVIPTFIIKGATGYVAGKVAFMNGKEGKSTIQNIIGFILGGIVSLFGYFVVNWAIFKGWQGAVTSLLTSITTTAIGIVIAIPLSMALKSATKGFVEKLN
ncbi:putative membrane protein [Clostridium moniliforme]|uniref:Membrane protein n=1 Tax=Clostridium moniliforme TaxID=39489 RepID=A0ABS4EXU1_9CLOT|nr:ECF transporter S component [Clostridium moniliforme]MBP1888815.1 putative membrane protein [Clostridium moniliforme]